jgi:hypothetical protein
MSNRKIGVCRPVGRPAGQQCQRPASSLALVLMAASYTEEKHNAEVVQWSSEKCNARSVPLIFRIRTFTFINYESKSKLLGFSPQAIYTD